MAKKLPEELKPALALYTQLLSEGERLPVKAIEKYFSDANSYVGRGTGDDDFAIVAANRTRRGLAFQYAMERLHFILTGTEKAPAARPTRARARAVTETGPRPRFRVE